jgi:hypothetical protein
MRERAQAAPGAATQSIPIHEVPRKAGHVRVGGQGDGVARARRRAGLGGRGATCAGERRDGAAALLLLPSGVIVLINGGPDGTGLSAARARRLPFYQRSLDLIVLTDPRAGDARGLQDAAGRFNAAQAAAAGMLHPTSEYIAWLDALKGHGTKRAQIRQGDTLWLDR